MNQPAGLSQRGWIAGSIVYVNEHPYTLKSVNFDTRKFTVRECDSIVSFDRVQRGPFLQHILGCANIDTSLSPPIDPSLGADEGDPAPRTRRPT